LLSQKKNIYKHDPKTYKIKKFETPLAQVKSISLSSNEDTYVIVHCKEPYRDLCLDLGLSGEERVSEFVTVIVTEVSKITGETIPVNFTSSITFNTSRTPKGNKGHDMTTTFESTTDPKVVNNLFKKGKNGYVILYPPRKNVLKKSAEQVLASDENNSPGIERTTSSGNLQFNNNNNNNLQKSNSKK